MTALLIKQISSQTRIESELNRDRETSIERRMKKTNEIGSTQSLFIRSQLTLGT